MPTGTLDTLDLQRRIAADPNVQAILRDPRYTTPMLRDAAVQNYLTNDPRSPLHAINGAEAQRAQGTRGAYSYHYDPVTGRLAKVTTGPQHWYTDPGVIGPIVAGSAMAGFGAAGAAGSGGGASGGGAAAASGGVPAMPWTIPAGFEASMGAAPPAAAAAGGGLLGGLKNFLTSKKGVGDVAGLAALLPLLTSRGGGGGSTPFADLKLPADDPALLNDTRAAYALQQKRVNQTQPAFDALVSQAYGMTPMRYRGAAPEGVSSEATAAPSGAYAYRGPQFG